MSSSPFPRRTFLTLLGATGAAVTTAGAEIIRALPAAAAIPGPASYSATWASVDQHPPAAEWFQDAKFGIYYHWGAFSVPAYANEWYPRNMYNNGSNENNHHKSVYGDPSVWPYHNFINGARDKAGNLVQFAPRLRSAGGNFDPDEWVQVFLDAGARFAGPVAEHHDGFSMWNSSVNEWNSVSRGPRLDLLRLHADAIRAKGLKLLVAMHHAYNFTGFYQWVPSQSDASLRKLYGQLGTAAEQQLWYDKLREVIDGYQPDILWQDFNLLQLPESPRLDFLSYYYNRAVAWDKEVVATYKDGFNNRGEVFDFGDYLRRFGEAVYSTRAWSVFGEGPTQMGGGTFQTPRTGTAQDIRFTRSKDGRVLYATMLGWPGSTVNITTLAAGRINLGTLTSVQLLGSTAGTYINLPTRTQDGNGLRITMPSSAAPYSAPAYVVKLVFSGQIPALGGGSGVPTGWARITNVSTGLALDSGGSVASGSQLKQWSWDGSANLQWQLVDAGGGWYRIVNRTNGMVADSWGNTANGATAMQAPWNGGNNQQWRLDSMGNGRYQIVNRGTGTALDSGGDATAGARVKLWAPGSSTNLQWTIAAV